MINKDSIGYYGFATISFYRGKDKVKTIKVKNNGTRALFEYLSKTVCGIDVSAYMPKYLDIGTITSDLGGGTEEFVSCLTNRVPLTSGMVNNIAIEDLSTVAAVASKFTALIPNRTISSVALLGNKVINCLRLYNVYEGASYDVGLLAQIKLKQGGSDNESIQVSLASQYSLMIDWIMTFGNVLSNSD